MRLREYLHPKTSLIIMIIFTSIYVLFHPTSTSSHLGQDLNRKVKVIKIMINGPTDSKALKAGTLEIKQGAQQKYDNAESRSQEHLEKYSIKTTKQIAASVKIFTSTSSTKNVTVPNVHTSNDKAFHQPTKRIYRIMNRRGSNNNDYYADQNTKTYPLTLKSDYIINNRNICGDKSNITVLVMIHTATDHLSRRQTIRNTYASRHLFLPAEVRVVFLLGRPTVLKQRTIQVEADAHNDIVQGDFLDSYHNLTHKAVMGLRWVYESCQNAKYVVKVDDDVIFDMWKFLSGFKDKDNGKTIWCNAFTGAAIQRAGKWAVSQREFPNSKHYPWPYCGGFAVIMNAGAILPLFEAAFESPFFWIDDVYVYGILRNKAKGLTLKHLPQQFKITVFGGYCPETQPTCDVLAVSNHYSNKTLIWNGMKRRSNQ